MRMKRKVAGTALLATAVVVVVAAWNTLALPSLPPVQSSAMPAPAGLNAAAERLGAAVRIPTVSGAGAQHFAALHALLASSFPLAHANLQREVVGDGSLLYTWRGEDPNLPPILLLAHMDVVPIDPVTEKDWQHPPFSGKVVGGYIWGRGAMDMKNGVMASMEGVEALLGAGFQPRRTILLAFGHDEELGGSQGAAAMAALLAQRKVKALFSLDEGGFILENMIAGVTRPVAQIALSEKGMLNLALSVNTPGGHSSVPPSNTAIGRLGRALARLEARQMPASLDGPGGQSIRELAPAMPLAPRVALANTWLTEPLLVRQLSASPATNAMLRTTTAPTMLNAGVKENVLPAEARAVVNFRISPGDSVEAVKRHVQEAIDDPLVRIEPCCVEPVEPSPLADRTTPAYRLIANTINQIVPDAVVTSGMVVGGTDSKHYRQVATNSYRFIPLRISPSELPRYHGVNERIGVKEYGEMISFYTTIMRESSR